MTKTPSRHTSARGSARKAAAVLSLALACGLFASGANAQVYVTDKLSISSNKTDFAAQLAKTVDQYNKQLEQYKTQLDQYHQMISKIQGLSTGMSLTPNTLQPADAGPLIQAKCAGASGGILGNVMKSMTSLLSQPMDQSQQQICAQIITTQVDKYNKTVDMLNKMNTYSSMYSQVEQVASSVDTVADAGRASNQVQVYNTALTTDMSHWEAQMRADDAIIKTLEDQQSILSQVALNGGGSSSILGDALPNTRFQNAIHGAGP